ncbi:allantoate amidohydrolase [Egicoccus halophilus]
MWAQLADIGREPAGGYRRFVWSAADLTLREWFVGEANARGLGVHEDRAGNLWAWWGDPSAGNAVVTGSHLDSVPSGGAFDGPLGVVSAFLAVDRLLERGTMPDRPVAVVAFSDEEGGRYGIACGGSRILSGLLPGGRALSLKDDDGVPQSDALVAAGRSLDDFGADPEVLGRIGTFVELHVEQGRRLVELDAPVGVASAIRGHGRWRFDFDGRPDHAGTTRLEDRADPMLAQARLVLAAREAAERHGCVATVGKVLVDPNAVNAIPSRVRAWLDVRGDDDELVHTVVEELSLAVAVEAVEESWTPRVDFEVGLRDRLAAGLGGVPVLPTGAGHDAGILASVGIDAAMLFVRNPTGVSHAPDEFAETADCLAGVDALTTVLGDLAWT